uniref:Opsin 3 n=1 Tax=Laticauda laticaudata TaxID=8630 RepID=A0A8C5RPV4_LATLA
FVHQPGAHAGGRGLGERRRQQAAGDSGTPFSASTYPLLALLIAVIGFVGLCNNVLVLGLYLKFKRLRTPANLFLVNISLSDLLVSFFGLSFTFLSCLRNGWARDEAGCVWDGFSNSLFAGSSSSDPADSHTVLLCISLLHIIPLLYLASIQLNH